MMQYNLTEEQSTEFYNNLKTAVAVVDELHETAISIFEGWYQGYLNNHRSFFGFKPMSIKKFGKKITLTNGIQIIESEDGLRRLENEDGWGANLRPLKIMKLIANKDLVQNTVDVVRFACLSSIYYNSEYRDWCDKIDKIEKYMTVPYTITQEWLDIMEQLSREIDSYKSVLERFHDFKNTNT